MSFISGTAAAILGNDAQRHASNRNYDAAMQTNLSNERLFHEGRGSAGNAILPEYFGGLEAQLGKDVTAYYNASSKLQGTPEEQLAKYKAIADRFRPDIAAGDQAVSDIFTGALTDRRLGYVAPVKAARLAGAKGQKFAILDALNQRLAELNAQDASKGFVGGSSFQNSKNLAATIAARRASAAAESQANLENALTDAGIKDAGESAKLQSLNLPGQRLQTALTLERTPYNALGDSFQSRTAPLTFFRMNPGQARYDRPPSFEAIASPAQIALTQLGSFNRDLASIYLSKQRQKGYGQSPYPVTNYSEYPSGLGSTTGFDQYGGYDTTGGFDYPDVNYAAALGTGE